MSISSTGLYGSATIVNDDLFNDVSDLKEQVTTLTTSYLITTQEHRDYVTKYTRNSPKYTRYFTKYTRYFTKQTRYFTK